MDLTAHPFWEVFPAGKAERLIASATVLMKEKGDILFRENDPSDALYLVMEGEVMLMKEVDGRSPVNIAVLGPGDYFGELGLLDRSLRSASARIVRNARLARVEQMSFDEALSGAPMKTFRSIVSRISSNLRETNKRWLTATLRKEKMGLVGEMANTIVHDLRSPFTIIDLACQTIGARNEDEETKRFCGIIAKQVERMTAMVSDILEFSKGTSHLCCRPTKVAHLFETFASYNGLELEKKPLTLETSPVEALVFCDEEKLLRVLQNLFNNAADSMGERAGRIKLTAALHGEQVEISLADNGPGIPEAIQATLFEPFVTMDKAKGTGLGLAIARSVVTAHGGEISFDTEREVGTTFRILLPVVSPVNLISGLSNLHRA